MAIKIEKERDRAVEAWDKKGMSLEVHIMGSSSSGNCALIEGGGVRVLVDAGFSGRKICEWLRGIGKPIETVTHVLLTHEHGDHVCGLRGLSRHGHLRIWATRGTVEACQRGLQRPLGWAVFEAGARFCCGGLEVESFRIPHDALDPVGFVIRAGGGSLFEPRRSVGWMTDLGYVPTGLDALMSEVDLLVLEANHDPQLLEADVKRPYAVKTRIMGRHGHLSNAAARAFMESVPRPRWQRVLLGHISRDCNSLEAVRACFGGMAGPWRLEVLHPEAVGCGVYRLGVGECV